MGILPDVEKFKTEADTFREWKESGKRNKKLRKSVGTEKIGAAGLEYRVVQDGHCLAFDSPHVHYYPSTQKLRDFRFKMTVKIGSERFVKWMKKNAGNDNALPVGAEDGAKKKLTFGAYKDQRIDEVPSHYLEWIIGKFDKKSAWIQNARLELIRRDLTGDHREGDYGFAGIKKFESQSESETEDFVQQKTPFEKLTAISSERPW